MHYQITIKTNDPSLWEKISPLLDASKHNFEARYGYTGTTGYISVKDRYIENVNGNKEVITYGYY